jgi:DNA polymerase-3 subunit delta
MPSSTEHALRKAVASGVFAPVYYLYGEDEFRKEEAVGDVLAAAVPGESRDFNVETRRGGDVSAEVLEAVLGTPPLMSPRRAVALRDVGSLKKDASRVLARYLEQPAPDTVLLLVATADSKRDSVLSDASVSVEFPALTGERVRKWIAHRAGLLGATIPPGACALLHEAVGNDLPSLVSEIDKLVSYVRGQRPTADAEGALAIDEEAVGAVVGVRKGETMSDLLDRVALRDAPRAVALVDHVLAQPKTTAVSLVMALTTQTLALGWGRARLDRGLRPGRLEQEYRSLLAETKAFPMRPWGEAAANWAKATERWTVPTVDRALRALEAADAALKESRVSSDEHVIVSLVLSMCAGGEAPTAPRAGTGTAA